MMDTAQAQKLTLGMAQLGMRYGIARSVGAPQRRNTFAILESALEYGIRRVDTAPAYGSAEKWLGAFLANHPAAFAVTTKLPELPAGISSKQIAAYVNASLEESLHCLGIEQVDCYLVHRAQDIVDHGTALVDALEDQRGRGRVARLGISAYTPGDARLLRAHPALTVLQHPLNLLDRRILEDPVLAEIRGRGVRLEARSILLQGLLALDREHVAVGRLGASAALSALTRCLEPFGVSATNIALPFVLATGVDAALIGVESQAQLDALMSTLALEVPPELTSAICALPRLEDGIVDPRNWKLT